MNLYVVTVKIGCDCGDFSIVKAASEQRAKEIAAIRLGIVGEEGVLNATHLDVAITDLEEGSIWDDTFDYST